MTQGATVLMIRSRVVCAVLLSSIAACSGAGDAGAPAGREWSGTVTTEGNVTTVVNESGSVWGGDIALVEEASIGVDAGEDAYMLGSVAAVWATDDLIYVVDRQVPAVRAYDLDGRYLRDVGGEGSGPAEYREPGSLAVDSSGNLYVRDYGNDRIMVFSRAGNEVGTLPLDGGFGTSTSMIMTLGGTLYNYQRLPSGDPEQRSFGQVPRSLTADETGEPIAEPELEAPEGNSLRASGEGISIGMGVPFAPGVRWTVTPGGAVLVGVNDEYSFEIRYPDGSVTRVVKRGGRVPVEPGEAAWHRKRILARIHAYVPDWTWNGNDIPAVKPAYGSFLPDRSGRIWVTREGPGAHVGGECSENPQPSDDVEPCWSAPTLWDVFDEEGRFLGSADVPVEVSPSGATFVEGDLFLASVTDEMGTPMVKRYRLVYPDNE